MTHDKSTSKVPEKVNVKYKNSVGIKHKFLSNQKFSTSSTEFRKTSTLKQKFNGRIEETTQFKE